MQIIFCKRKFDSQKKMSAGSRKQERRKFISVRKRAKKILILSKEVVLGRV
jgi:hypothetical protein